LLDADTNLIHSIQYDLTWYQSNFKKNGGWSLEMIDTKNPCNVNNNWKASNDASGGTPGRKNSVDGINPDNISPDLIRAFPINDTTLEIFFSEPMNASAITNLQNFVVDNSAGKPISAAFGRYSEQSIVLTFANNFQPKTIYNITVQNIFDCSGNQISNNTAKFGLPETIDSIDVVLNEVLYYPKTYGNRFVEIYNRSNKIFDLSKLKIANTDAAGNINTTAFVQKNGYLFFPNDYIAITDSRDNILQNYSSLNPNGVLEIGAVPTLDDHNGTVALITPSGKIIDELTYSDAWHYPLLHSKQGVSLERISSEGKTQDENNWHSAASVVGFATPAYLNSQSNTSTNTSAEIDVEPKVFTPDDDGKNDVLLIRYRLDNAGYNANINIYNSLGVLVKTISNNQTLEQTGFFQWDGTDASGNKLTKGIYIVYAELFNTSGKKINLKKDCVLGGKE
jgi:flagellar hook assembly protein FlgD